MTLGGYDPVKRAEEAAALVCRGNLRRYYRFRPARFYGGIATADCLGCCLRCIFCWSWDKVVNPTRFGEFYSSKQVASKLDNIARKKGFFQVRISGNEPTIAREHLLGVLESIPKDLMFILETNGILIGHDKTYAHDLAKFENLYVRVSLKGCSGKEFSRLTGAEPKAFELQLQALENLAHAGVNTHPAAMVSFSSPEAISALRDRLASIDKTFENIEMEELMLYGHVEDHIRKAGIDYE